MPFAEAFEVPQGVLQVTAAGAVITVAVIFLRMMSAWLTEARIEREAEARAARDEREQHAARVERIVAEAKADRDTCRAEARADGEANRKSLDEMRAAIHQLAVNLSRQPRPGGRET
jgi:hypothetical protein